MLTLEEIKGKTPEEIVSFYKKLINEKEEELKKQTKIANSKTLECEKLTFKLNQLLQQRYGRQSEKVIPPEQIYLFDEAALPQQEMEQLEQDDIDITVASHTRKKKGRRPLPKDLPRVQHYHDLSDHEKVCDCGCILNKIGEVKSEQLEFIPAQVRVIEHIRLKYACKSCEENVKLATLPKQPIPKSIATAGLLSHILVSKFCDHLPFYRQELIMQRMGVDMTRATLCRWAVKSATLFEPLLLLMQQKMQRYDIGYADETDVQVLKELGREPHHKSTMWLFIGGSPKERCFVYQYHPSRAHTVPQAFWGDFKGYLHSDGFSAYQTLFSKQLITGVHCWAHARRQFVNVVKSSRKAGLAQQAVKQIAELYKIEKLCKQEKLTPELILKKRQKSSKPRLRKFKKWLDDNIKSTPPNQPIGKALQYCLKFWGNLENYINDGRLDIDNNLTERSIKPFVIGRKNWMFHDRPEGAKAGAIIYSLIETCKAHKIEPYGYLKYALTEVINCQSQEDYEKLLPFNVAQIDIKKQWCI